MRQPADADTFPDKLAGADGEIRADSRAGRTSRQVNARLVEQTTEVAGGGVDDNWHVHRNSPIGTQGHAKLVTRDGQQHVSHPEMLDDGIVEWQRRKAWCLVGQKQVSIPSQKNRDAVLAVQGSNVPVEAGIEILEMTKNRRNSGRGKRVLGRENHVPFATTALRNCIPELFYSGQNGTELAFILQQTGQESDAVRLPAEQWDAHPLLEGADAPGKRRLGHVAPLGGPRQVLGLQQGKSVFNELQVHTCPYHMYEQHVKSAFLTSNLPVLPISQVCKAPGPICMQKRQNTTTASGRSWRSSECSRASGSAICRRRPSRWTVCPKRLPGRVYRLGNGGDKTRKPGFLVVEAKEQRADCLIFQGITPRKDGHQTAAAAANLEKA